MPDRENLIKGLEGIIDYFFDIYRNNTDSYKCAKAQEYSDCAIDVIALLKEQEAEIDYVMPVVHAHWTQCGTKRVCSVCGVKVCAWAIDCTLKYCPNCGAKMDEKDVNYEGAN